MIYDKNLTFGTRYMRNYDPKKNYVVMDDDSITEQSGYKTTEELYEEMIRAGRVLRANRLSVSLEELEQIEEFSSYETRYELDPVEQDQILKDFEERLLNAEEKRKSEQAQKTTANSDNQQLQKQNSSQSQETQTQKEGNS